MHIKRSLLLQCFAATFLLFFSLSLKAQKEVSGYNESINKVAEIVKPLREQADRILKEDKTGKFAAFQAEVRKLNEMKASAKKSALTKRILDTYQGFFQEVWSRMKVDEKSYQQKIRDAFPSTVGEKIVFQPFLNFTVQIITTTATPVAPETPPAPENKCIDVCPIAAGEVNGTSDMISGGGGSYGNCFLRANSWGAVAGKNEVFSRLKNNISIPGTLPSDGRKLRVRKSFEVKQEAHSFAVLGFGYSETDVETHTFSSYLLAMSPVIFATGKTFSKTVNEEYVLSKPEVGKSIFKAHANNFSVFISGNWCFSECTSIKWNICEEK